MRSSRDDDFFPFWGDEESDAGGDSPEKLTLFLFLFDSSSTIPDADELEGVVREFLDLRDVSLLLPAAGGCSVSLALEASGPNEVSANSSSAQVGSLTKVTSQCVSEDLLSETFFTSLAKAVSLFLIIYSTVSYISQVKSKRVSKNQG